MTPTTIDLALAGTENGVPIYAEPLDAITMQITYGIGWLLAHYPREFLHGLGLLGVVATCAYLAWDSTPRRTSPQLRASSPKSRKDQRPARRR
jgi:hypothetical protein